MVTKQLSDKLRDVSRKAIDLKEVSSNAKSEYEQWCAEQGKDGEKPHQSTVHSYQDALNQAAVLAIPGKTEKKAEGLYKLTLLAHLFDDKVDPMPDFEKRYADCNNFEDFMKNSPPDIKKIAKEMISIAKTGDERNAVKDSILKLIGGTRVQRTKTLKEQKRYADDYKNSMINSIDYVPLKEDLETIHPMLVYLTTHGDVGEFFALEGFGQNNDLANLYSLFYSPMLYAHDKEEEVSEDDSLKVLYGKEMTENGFITDNHLAELINVFDDYITEIPDANLNAHFKQMQLVYDSFEPVLSTKLRDKYKESMEKFKNYVDQTNKKNESTTSIKTSRKGLEGMFSIFIIASFSLAVLTNPLISGQVVAFNFFVTKPLIGFISLIMGLFFLGLLITLRSRARRFRNSFFK